MKKIEFEKKMLECRDEKAFLDFIKDHKNLRLEIDNVDIRKEENIEENSYMTEESLIEYLEEISYIKQLSEKDVENIITTLDEEESIERLIYGNLRENANIAFDYLYEGIDYLDLVQEGTIAIAQGIENYKNSYGDIMEYLKLWIRRAMLLFVEDRINSDKMMYQSYFTHRKEELLEHEIVNELEGSEEEEIENTKEIDKKIAEVAEIELENLKKKLNYKEEVILKKYYGLIGEKRESLFEIENDLELERGEGEKLFESAIMKITLVGGKIIKL